MTEPLPADRKVAQFVGQPGPQLAEEANHPCLGLFRAATSRELRESRGQRSHVAVVFATEQAESAAVFARVRRRLRLGVGLFGALGNPERTPLGLGLSLFEELRKPGEGALGC